LNTLHFQSTIVETEKVNPLFSRVKIHVAYDGENRNGSFISRETFNNASSSAAFCPIIGEWSETVDDFRGHGGKIEITDDSIKYVQTTIPYGCIGNEEPTWETVEDENGESKEYFTLTGYVWSSRYPELESLITNSKSQSMEVEIINGKYQTVSGKKLYAIDEMVFSGFCILGDDVEPCFENSTISTYSLNKDQYKEEFKQMMAELKFSLRNYNKVNKDLQKGGKEMEELQKLLEKYSLTLEDLSSKEINHEEFSLEELEVKIQEVFKNEPSKEFTLTAEQLEDELKRELCGIETMQDPYWEDYKYPRYSFVDYMPEQNIVVAYDCKECILVGMNYNLTNENVEVDANSTVRYKVNFVPMDLAGDPDEGMGMMTLTSITEIDHKVALKEKELTKQFKQEKESAQETLDKANADFAKLQEDFSKLEETAKELEQFKLSKEQKEREDAETALFESFSEELTEDEMSPIKERKSEFALEELEEKLFALAGRKKAKLHFSKSPETKPIRFNLPVDNKPTSDKEWADLIEQYKNK
jgi:DNA repair exonuclease SbcCD ATPase subunit